MIVEVNGNRFYENKLIPIGKIWRIDNSYFTNNIYPFFFIIERSNIIENTDLAIKYAIEKIYKSIDLK